MPLENANLSDLFAYVILLVTVAILVLFWLSTLILVVVQFKREPRVIWNSRALIQFLFVNVFLLLNLGLSYFFIGWQRSNQDREFFKRSDDLYILIWIPVNLILIVGLAEFVLRMISYRTRKSTEDHDLERSN